MWLSSFPFNPKPQPQGLLEAVHRCKPDPQMQTRPSKPSLRPSKPSWTLDLLDLSLHTIRASLQTLLEP